MTKITEQLSSLSPEEISWLTENLEKSINVEEEMINKEIKLKAFIEQMKEQASKEFDVDLSDTNTKDEEHIQKVQEHLKMAKQVLVKFKELNDLINE